MSARHRSGRRTTKIKQNCIFVYLNGDDKFISELLKQQANAGDRGGLYFYRDQNGVEADVLIDRPDRMTVVEIKAGQTVTTDLLSPARRVRELLSAVKNTDAVVVYAGDARQDRSDVQLLPWNKLTALPLN